MNIPNIEFIDKLLVFLGLGIVITSGLYIYNSYKDLRNRESEFDLAYTRYINELKRSEENFTIAKMADSVHLKKVNSIIDKMKSSPHDFTLLKKEYDSISKIHNLYSNNLDLQIDANRRRNDSLALNFEEKSTNIQSFIKAYNSDINLAWNAVLAGCIFFLLGLFSWMQKERFEKTLLIRQNLDKPTYSERCQSCGKKFNALIAPGKESDGQKNFHFCRNCYHNGEFLEPQLSLLELINRTKTDLLTKHLSSSRIKKILKSLESLDRWKHDHYA